MKNIWTRMLLCCLLLGAGSVSRAQQGAASMGIIDEDKLAQGYVRWREALVKLDTQLQEMDSRLQSRELLASEQAKRFDALLLKEERSAAENTELDALAKQGTNLRAEQLGLIGKVDRSDADNKRLEQLNGASQLNGAALQSLSDRLLEVYKGRQTKIDDESIGRINKVIEQVAADKKLSLVWRKRAVIWNASALDITDEVLGRLNK